MSKRVSDLLRRIAEAEAPKPEAPTWTTKDCNKAKAIGQYLAEIGLPTAQFERKASHSANVHGVPGRYRVRWLAECGRAYDKTKKRMKASAADTKAPGA